MVIVKHSSQTSSHAFDTAAEGSLFDRLRWLKRFERLFGSRVDQFCSIVAAEIGKSEWEVLSTELMPLAAALRWHRRSLRRLLRPKRLRGGAAWQLSQRLYTHREPLGTVGIIATWNYPILLLGIQVVQAIAAGNRVIVKPSEHAPWSQKQLLELMREAGLSDQWLQWTDSTREAGAQMLRDSALDHVVFTGSTEVGREVAQICAERLIPTTLELSGRDSAFVLADADVQYAAASLWNAVVMNAGQTCMAPRRILVVESVYNAFIQELAGCAAAVRPVRMVRPADLEQCLRLARNAIDAGGRALSPELEPLDEHTLRPLAIVDCPPEAELVAGGHFGPVVAVIRCADFEEALAIHASCDQKLATSVFTRDEVGAGKLAPLFKSGVVTINDCIRPTGHPAAPISGLGASGWGSSQGVEGLLAMTRPVVVARTGRFMRLPLEVPSQRVQEFLRKMLRGRRGGGDEYRSVGDDRVHLDKADQAVQDVHGKATQESRATPPRISR